MADIKKEAFQKIWVLQGDLFEAQREIIVWSQQFVPEENKSEYNSRILKINQILQKLTEQEKIMGSEEPQDSGETV